MEGIKANFKAATRSTLPHVAFLRLFIVGRNSEVDDFQSLVEVVHQQVQLFLPLSSLHPSKSLFFAVILIDFMLLYR